MKIIYPYNEILPLRRAHDAYIVRNCAALAQAGHEVTLLIGRGSLEKKELLEFYNIDSENPLKIVHLPLLRRKNLLRIQWNWIFFMSAQRTIEKLNPDCVICSVLKQADFHTSRKIKECLYFYEVHQLQWYPSLTLPVNLKKIFWERSIFERCDLITVTTNALKDILKNNPYQVQTPIEKVPLACDFEALEKTTTVGNPLQLYYVGQLYASQGLKNLLEALSSVEHIHLNVVGGKLAEIKAYELLCRELKIESRVTFKGFQSSNQLKEALNQADAFITTFENKERMPYVAHTKLHEYQAWKKPVIAPNMQVVREHLTKGALLFDTNQKGSLIAALNQIQDPLVYQKLLEEALEHSSFTWEKRGCLLNKLLNKIQFFQKSTLKAE